ncbi:MAG: 30S ribosomal protein S6 [Candidatus Parcubacteria bacterium]|nr:30S ribosomal protein S6 [Candidatus Parcubacteria bacterium]
MEESKKNLYELSYWLKDSLSEEESQTEKDQISGFLNELKGDVSEASSPHRKALAYPIDHFKEGYFGVFRFGLESLKISDLKSKLDANKNILRFLIVVYVTPKLRTKPTKKEKKPEEMVENVEVAEIVEEPEVKKEKEISFEELDKKLEEILKD